MGSILKGILGGFSGTVGTVVGANWKGIDYMKSKSRKSSAAATTAQLTQQSKFSLMIKFLRLFGSLLSKSFNSTGQTGANAALSYNLQNAITGDYPAFDINYSKVLLSHGSLKNGGNPMAKPGVAGKVSFTWTDNSDGNSANVTDNAVLVAYDPISKEAIYKQNGAKRSVGSDELDVPELSGATVETWIAFISDKGKKVSDSIYTGKVAVL